MIDTIGGTVRKSKLDTLTSIRFIAAALIVIGHAHNTFGSAGIATTFALGQGVSIFFVLSGFILTYNYSDRLSSRKEIFEFFLARFARLWPLHIVAILLLILLVPINSAGYLPNGHKGIAILANIFLVQSWSPIKALSLSLNGVAWSISVELFFYLWLPVLLFKWRKTWVIKILISAVTVITCIIIANHFNLNPDDSFSGIGLFGFIYANPITRIFEFIIGIITCYLYRNLFHFAKGLKTYEATFIEVGILLFSIASMWISPILSNAQPVYNLIGSAGQRWILGSGSCFIFAILILVLSFQKGYVSKLFSNKYFVLLGEISFALYLTHTILLKFYESVIIPFIDFPLWSMYIAYWVTAILISYLLFIVVEKPCRKWIINIPKNISAYKENRNLKSHNLLEGNLDQTKEISFKRYITNKKVWISLVCLCIIILSVRFGIGNLAFYISSSEANKKHSITVDTINTEQKEFLFDKKFMLSSVTMDIQSNGTYKLEMLWETLEDVKLKYSIGVHILDNSNNIIYNTQIIQNINMKYVKSRTMWANNVRLPKDIIEKANNIGIAVYESPDSMEYFLPVISGESDWDGHRLLISKESIQQKIK